MESLTVAKITLTVIDELIQLGIFTAKIVQDARDFDNVRSASPERLSPSQCHDKIEAD
jgi:hypothetical protein